MLSSIFDRLPDEATLQPGDQQELLLRQLDGIGQKMKMAQELFDLSDDDALTDACIYQLKALGSYYRYLLAEARRCGCCRQGEKQPAGSGLLRAAGLL